MGGVYKDMIQKEEQYSHCRIMFEKKGKHSHPVLCNACYFEADDEDKKIL
jgi:hypothetical protein